MVYNYIVEIWNKLKVLLTRNLGLSHIIIIISSSSSSSRSIIMLTRFHEVDSIFSAQRYINTFPSVYVISLHNVSSCPLPSDLILCMLIAR